MTTWTGIGSPSLQVVINHHGAEVTSLRRDGWEYMWQADRDVWPRYAPVLFPIVGRLKDNGYRHNENTYVMGQHGFARDCLFRLVEKNASACTFELTDTAETRKTFPFGFTLRILYKVADQTLHTTYEIVNTGHEALPAAIGAHPGFACPLGGFGLFADHYLEFEHNHLMQTPLQNGLRTNYRTRLELPDNRLYLTDDLFDNDALVFEGHQVNRVALASRVSARRIDISCQGWPYFGIWSKKGNTRFVCLEPWFGITDPVAGSTDLVEKQGMVHLAPGARFTCQFSVTIS